MCYLIIYRQHIIFGRLKRNVVTLKNNHNGSNYDHDDGDDENNENDDCCHFLDLLYQVSFTAFWHLSQI